MAWCQMAPSHYLNQSLMRSFGIQSMVIFTLTHWGPVTHICVGNLTIIGSDNGLSPGQRQAITWTSFGILLIGPPGTNFNEMLIEIHTFSFKKIHLKMSSAKRRPFCLGLNVLIPNMSIPKLCLNLHIWNHSHMHIPGKITLPRLNYYFLCNPLLKKGNISDHCNHILFLSFSFMGCSMSLCKYTLVKAK